MIYGYGNIIYKGDSMTAKDDNIKKYETEINNLNNELEDIVENLKFMLQHNNIRDINLLNIHYQIYDIIIKIDQLETFLFNLKY